MSESKLFLTLIKSLEQKEFEELVLQYLIEVEGIKNIIKCNGPYDSGLDMRTVNYSEIEIQYQATVQEKGFERKLFEDLKKAKKNVEEYDLPPKVNYFYSYGLSTNTVLKYKKQAKTDYNLILNIIEGNTLSAVIENYEKLKSYVLNVSNLDTYSTQSDFFDDPKVKAFYDLMSFGSSTDIKYNILKSFVLNFLNSKGITNSDILLSEINEHFGAKLVPTYFEGFCHRLNSEKKIISDKSGNIDLTPSEKQRLGKVLENYHIEEALLRKELHNLLKAYDMQGLVDEMIIYLSQLHESNYAVNLGEFTKRNSNITDLQTATTKFKEYVKENINDESEAEILTKKLLKIADDNDILARIAAGQVYSKVNDPDRLQEYIQRLNNNKDIFLDTNVIINALCVFYEANSEYRNFYYVIARQFLDFARKNRLNLTTVRTYATETVSLFKEALAIVPFTKLPNFEALGGSQNVLFNFFLHLKDYDQLHEDTNNFEDFLKEFHFEIKPMNPDYHYKSQIDFLLTNLGITIEDPIRYDISKAKSLILDDLIFHRRSKSKFAINNDAIMLMRLGDKKVEINPIDPIFCTWDLSLLRIRKKFFNEFPNCTKWFMYTPSRLMDHYSMMNFQIKQGTLSNEVLSILDQDFSFQAKTQSLLDTIMVIINPNNEIGLKYTNALAELRQKEIVQVDHKPEFVPEEKPEINPVDFIFFNLFTNYVIKGDEKLSNSFKSIFTKEELFEDVFKILDSEIKHVLSNGIISTKLYSKMDKVLEKSTLLDKKIKNNS